MKKVRLIIAAAALAMSAQAVLLDENFDSRATGATNAAGIGAYAIYTSGTTGVRVVDSGSIPADPFGGSGNKSLYLYDLDTVQAGHALWKASEAVMAGRLTI
ncbi:MAG: hypothetical protein IT583_06325, partial [Verrucomicrobia bacterium]|nr:hypothetical protein [Verrucomicrobiota bacterium]